MYRTLTRISASLLVALGVTMFVVTLWHGGGVGLVLGSLFVAAGAGRLWLLRRKAP
jgi:hypothetical protein